VLRLLVVDVERARATSEELCAYAQDQGFPYWQAFGGILHGYIAATDRAADAVAEIRENLARYRATGARLGLTWFLTLLAVAHGRARQPAEGLRAVDEARDLADATGERFIEATLYRVRGELLLVQGGPGADGAAEAAFRQAIDVARRQAAKTLELHAATSVARLHLKQGRRAEARAELGPIVSWFTEGFKALDLAAARAVLERIESDS
jgi:adenylate cyclase